MERYAHVTAGQQRAAADLLDFALTGSLQSVTQSVTEADDGVVRSRPEGAEVVVPLGEDGSGGSV
jgi:hypothetical protein